MAEGCLALDARAKSLGVHRSTAWMIIKRKHELDRSALETTDTMLANPQLPPSVRIVVLRYLAERPNGLAQYSMR